MGAKNAHGSPIRPSGSRLSAEERITNHRSRHARPRQGASRNRPIGARTVFTAPTVFGHVTGAPWRWCPLRPVPGTSPERKATLLIRGAAAARVVIVPGAPPDADAGRRG